MGETVDKYSWRFPAEWEPQSGVLLTWPHQETDWAPMLDEVLATYREMAKEISKSGDLLYIVSPKCVTNQEVGAEIFANIVCPTNDTWTRDHGPITLVREDDGNTNCETNGPTVNCRLLDYRFNGWGGKFPAELDNAINRHFINQVASSSDSNEYIDMLDFELEGGSIDTDGKGTVITTSSCLLRRNQPMTKHEIEERLRKDFCLERVLWVDYGHIEGDDTDGHVDTLVRFAPDDTLLYMGCDNPKDDQYDDLKAMEEQLCTFTTLDGKPYKMVKLPMPKPIYDEDGQRLPATYANFLVLPDRVLLPTYGQPDQDRTAHQLLEQAFPRRLIVDIGSLSLIRQHGSIHCSTMQLPRLFL